MIDSRIDRGFIRDDVEALNGRSEWLGDFRFKLMLFIFRTLKF